MPSDAVGADPLEELIERDDATARMKRALLAMSEPERAVLLAHRVGCPIEQIARDRRLATGDVNRLLDSAREYL